MFRKLIAAAIAAAFLSVPISSAVAGENGCCQKGTPGVCGAPVTVLGKKTCTLGWYKAVCTTKWNDCKKKDWMLSGPKLKAR